MFFTRSILATPLLLLLAARALATNHKGIPQVFSTGFEPESGLQITYESVGEAITDGDDLTGKDLEKVPKFSLGQSSGINTNAKFIIVMVDPDVNGDPENVVPQTLHYMRTDFVPTGQAVSVESDVAPAVTYAGPAATNGGNEGPHRYVFLLYRQPKEGFELKSVPADGERAGFNIKAWREANGLEPAIAGVHYLATPPNAAAAPPAESTTSCTTTEMPVETAPPVETTAPPAETTPPAETSPVDSVLTITDTVTVTASDCNCAAPTSSDGLTLTAAPPAETATATATETSAPAAAVTHSVIVGGPAGLVYTPEFVEAAVGDKVVFEFLARNHTVTQSTLDVPCALKADGVKSGFRSNPDSIPGKEIFEVVVDDLEPKWYFCAQANHCAMGMVFAINPKEKFPQFKDNAMRGSNGTVGGAPPNSTVPAQPIFEGSASGIGAKLGSVFMGVAAVIAFAA
ncbi:phosphatidylethanolamine-binding protein [Tricharina praecox]|uniref:phosphatidylethanolamine-binding protein n=1 Tax=Tricharina praecox TaxID=43433 RepID=UPI0022211F3D|nr:phosphatidylethanolamine-binding protein [Tricharina praecox]KAI5858932.1 phosphatidylethanolamine-binding protein [Tricharina praecox]